MKIWFQNRRTKWKKQENISNAEAAELMKAKKENQLSNNGNLKRPQESDNNNGGGAASPNMTENGLNALLSKLSPATRDEVSCCRLSMTLSLLLLNNPSPDWHVTRSYQSRESCEENYSDSNIDRIDLQRPFVFAAPASVDSRLRRDSAPDAVGFLAPSATESGRNSF